MLAAILVNILGILLFLYLFWRRLKEDYSSQLIFTTGFYMLFGILLGYFASRYFFPGWWFWLGFLGLALGFMLGIFRFRIRFFETLEAAGIGMVAWLGIVFLGDAVENSSLASFISFLAMIGLLTLFHYLDSRYRLFSWYKSGRIGFAGLTTLGTFFLVRTGVGVAFPFMLSFAGRVDVLLSGTAAFVFFLLTFHLSRQT